MARRGRKLAIGRCFALPSVVSVQGIYTSKQAAGSEHLVGCKTLVRMQGAATKCSTDMWAADRFSELQSPSKWKTIRNVCMRNRRLTRSNGLLGFSDPFSMHSWLHPGILGKEVLHTSHPHSRSAYPPRQSEHRLALLICLHYGQATSPCALDASVFVAENASMLVHAAA